MNCTYPLCFNTAQWVPVIALPTIRTAGTGEESKQVQTDRPTFLLFPEVCQQHRLSYAIEQCDLSPGDWAAIQDVCREKRPDLQVIDPRLLIIEFMPIGWTPGGYLELERGIDVEDNSQPK